MNQTATRTIAVTDADFEQAVMLFDKGEIVETLIGIRPKPDYARGLEKLL